MSRFRRIAANTRGRDLAGDIHGHFQRLQQCLDGVGFNPAVDRLFSIGDLVDRGPHSAQALDWLELTLVPRGAGQPRKPGDQLPARWPA
jgi:serine/threonine protein phosphatase 1